MITEWRTGDDAYVELSFSPCISLVSMVRRFVGDFYIEVLGDPAVTSRIAVATHELLENSARYSVDGRASVSIGVKKEANAISIRIETKNRANEEHIAILTQAIDKISAAPDAQAHYLSLMRTSAKRTNGSGLGLGRVRAETDMHLSYGIEGDIVGLCAEARFDKGAVT
jgi:hypothetical protein